MRFARIVIGATLLLGACTTTQGDVPLVDSSPLSSDGASVQVGTAIPQELADHEVREVEVGSRTLTLAIADSPTLRAQGLMHITDLGSLDGMLFYWRHEASGGFWMKDTVIPLDIVWFDVDGRFVGRASMTPCEVEDCPSYEPEGGGDYRYAIEANPGDLDWVTDDTVIVYTD